MKNFDRIIRKSTILSLFAILLGLNANANIVGMDAQNFNPTTSGLDFVTVHSSETLKPGILNLGLFVNYAKNSLPNFGKTSQGFGDHLWGMDLNAGFGILRNWEFGVSFPFVLYQKIDDGTGQKYEFTKAGNTEVKLNTKYRFFGDDSYGLATILSTNINRTQNNAYIGLGGGPIYNLELAYDKTFGKVAAAVNAGHRWRKQGTQIAGLPIQPYRNQWIGSAAASYYIEKWDTKIISEIFGSRPVDTDQGIREKQETTFEFLVGAKHDVNTNLAVHSGVGSQVLQGISSPDFRIYAGLNYTMGPLIKHKEPVLEKQEVQEERFITNAIEFKFNSAEMSDDNEEIFDSLVAQLNAKGFKKLTVEGHTDSIGAEEYNLKLSISRANAIRDHMIKHHGLSAVKITAIGYGETRPIADNGNFQGRQRNRRVEFVIEH